MYMCIRISIYVCPHFVQVFAAVAQACWPMIMPHIMRIPEYCPSAAILRPTRYPTFTEMVDHACGSEDDSDEQVGGEGRVTCKLD